MHNEIDIKTADGSFSAYVAKPATLPAPVVVVIQEIFGVTAGIRQVADELAQQGFIAICPDLFWRLEPGLQLSEHSESDWQKALGFYTRFDIDTGVDDIAATISVARRLPDATGKVGVMGFCLGGLMSFLTAARSDVDAAVEYYGGRTEEFVGEGGAITKPLLIHLAGEDEFIGKAAQAAIGQAFAANPNIEIHTYPGRNHAFARPAGDHYDAADATTANARTAAFFERELA
jgi:carboxymethylenebutenolidase